MIISELFEAPQQCPECGGISFSDLILAEKKDACYHKVKASAKVWPSAYASGRLVQCRKKGAANYGNKSEGVAEGKRSDTYHIVNKDGKPASLASYADKESAVKDRDAKHQGAEVRQLGPRGKVKSVAEGVLDEAVGMIIKGAAISGPDDQDIADQIAARTGGRVDSGSRGHHVLITYPTTQHRARAAVKIRKMFPGIELYKSGGNRNAIDEGMKADELSQYCEELVAEKGWDQAYKHARFMAQGNTDPSWGSVLKYLKSMKDGVAEEASPMIKPPANRFDNKQEAFDHAKQHGGKVFKSTYTDPNTGIQNIVFVVKKEQGMAEEYELAGVGVAYELGRRAYQERKTIKDNPYSATREARKYDEWEKGLERGKHDANDAKLFRRSVGENAGQPLSVQQLATISDTALDQAYGYGRSTPGNTFGWQANLKSAAYAKQMIDQGVTDIEAISDAIHKGWNTTAQAFVQDPEQFDDTAKLAAAGKLEAKLQQRAQLMKQNYSQLPEEEKEKDRVVARALLQAIRGEQQQGMAEGYVPINIYKGPTNPALEPKKVEKDYTPKYDPKVHGPVYDLEWQRQQNEKRMYNVVGKIDRKVLNPEPIKGQTAAEEFMKQNGLNVSTADIEQISTIRFHATGIDASGKRVVSEPLTDMKDVRNFYKQHGIDQFASTTDLTTTDDGSVTEGQLEMNTPDPVVVVQDLKGKILDKINLSVAAQKYKLGPPQNIKTQLAHQNYTTIGNYVIVSPMSGQPQDQTTTGQKQAFTATEGDQKKPKEVDYDDAYDDMVARVKKLAGLGPMKTVYDPAKRVYRNVPTAVQPPKK